MFYLSWKKRNFAKKENSKEYRGDGLGDME